MARNKPRSHVYGQRSFRSFLGIIRPMSNDRINLYSLFSLQTYNYMLVLYSIFAALRFDQQPSTEV